MRLLVSHGLAVLSKISSTGCAKLSDGLSERRILRLLSIRWSCGSYVADNQSAVYQLVESNDYLLGNLSHVFVFYFDLFVEAGLLMRCTAYHWRGFQLFGLHCKLPDFKDKDSTHRSLFNWPSARLMCLLCTCLQFDTYRLHFKYIFSDVYLRSY